MLLMHLKNDTTPDHAGKDASLLGACPVFISNRCSKQFDPRGTQAVPTFRTADTIPGKVTAPDRD